MPGLGCPARREVLESTTRRMAGRHPGGRAHVLDHLYRGRGRHPRGGAAVGRALLGRAAAVPRPRRVCPERTSPTERNRPRRAPPAHDAARRRGVRLSEGGGGHGNRVDHCARAVCARWRGLGLLAVAPVARGIPCRAPRRCLAFAVRPRAATRAYGVPRGCRVLGGPSETETSRRSLAMARRRARRCGPPGRKIPAARGRRTIRHTPHGRGAGGIS